MRRMMNHMVEVAGVPGTGVPEAVAVNKRKAQPKGNRTFLKTAHAKA